MKWHPLHALLYNCISQLIFGYSLACTSLRHVSPWNRSTYIEEVADTRTISPHAILAPALPVIFETNPFCGGPGSLALELSPSPKSSSSACTIIERPTTVVGPNIFTSLSLMTPLDLPSASTLMLPRLPTCLSSSSGAPCNLLNGL